jgi:hypothetical protein
MVGKLLKNKANIKLIEKERQKTGKHIMKFCNSNWGMRLSKRKAFHRMRFTCGMEFCKIAFDFISHFFYELINEIDQVHLATVSGSFSPVKCHQSILKSFRLIERNAS